jgi:hypothetical protein
LQRPPSIVESVGKGTDSFGVERPNTIFGVKISLHVAIGIAACLTPTQTGNPFLPISCLFGT